MAPQLSFAIDSVRGFELTGDGEHLMLKTSQTSSIALHCSVMHECWRPCRTLLAVGADPRQEEVPEIRDAV